VKTKEDGKLKRWGARTRPKRGGKERGDGTVFFQPTPTGVILQRTRLALIDEVPKRALDVLSLLGISPRELELVVVGRKS
jgi:hypothetical protein